jgi:hypothetical protein
VTPRVRPLVAGRLAVQQALRRGGASLDWHF